MDELLVGFHGGLSDADEENAYRLSRPARWAWILAPVSALSRPPFTA